MERDFARLVAFFFFFPQKWHKIGTNQKGKMIHMEDIKLQRQERDGGCSVNGKKIESGGYLEES